MLYLLWVILNFSLVLSFLYISFKAAKLVKQKMGLFAFIVFVVVVISSWIPATVEPAYFHRKRFDLVSEEKFKYTPGKSDVELMLDSSMIFDIRLRILYHLSDSGIITPIAAETLVNGCEGPKVWTPRVIYAKQSGNKISYYVEGDIDWRFLNNTVYTEIKRYKGLVSVNKRPY